MNRAQGPGQLGVSLGVGMNPVRKTVGLHQVAPPHQAKLGIAFLLALFDDLLERGTQIAQARAENVRGVFGIGPQDRTHGNDENIRVPTADDRIDEGDRLVVAGTRQAVESLDAV